jgi:glycosyltransferase involved in cell wall biosynthesis
VNDDRDPVVGFACSWWTPRAATWSFVAPRLRASLNRSGARIVDIETQRSLPLRALEVAASKITHQPWQYSRFERAMVDRKARSGAARLRPDAVIEIADVDTPLSVPYFPYQDMSITLGAASQRLPNGAYVNLLPASPARIEALAQRGAQRLMQATGFFAMSQWMADDAIDRGVPAERVRVVHAGLSAAPEPVRDPADPMKGRLLFVGLDFARKGGDAVVAAAQLLRDRGVDVTLTIVGPARWPLPGSPPSWIEYRGPVSAEVLRTLWARHDVFLMPSRFEAYGIALVEALAAGLPSIAYDAYAMPEFIRHGETGLLVDEVDPEALADAITKILDDPAFLMRVAAARPEILDRHDWDRSAERMIQFIAETLA